MSLALSDSESFTLGPQLTSTKKDNKMKIAGCLRNMKVILCPCNISSDVIHQVRPLNDRKIYIPDSRELSITRCKIIAIRIMTDELYRTERVIARMFHFRCHIANCPAKRIVSVQVS
jgi:hypothetical protein